MCACVCVCVCVCVHVRTCVCVCVCLCVRAQSQLLISGENNLAIKQTQLLECAAGVCLVYMQVWKYAIHPRSATTYLWQFH